MREEIPIQDDFVASQRVDDVQRSIWSLESFDRKSFYEVTYTQAKQSVLDAVDYGHQPLEMQIMLACRYLYVETCTIFYSENTFHFHYNPNIQSGAVTSSAAMFLLDRAPHLRAKIRSIALTTRVFDLDVVISEGCPEESAERVGSEASTAPETSPKSMQTLWGLLQGMQLRSVQIRLLDLYMESHYEDRSLAMLYLVNRTWREQLCTLPTAQELSLEYILEDACGVNLNGGAVSFPMAYALLEKLPGWSKS